MAADRIDEYSEDGDQSRHLWKRGLILVAFIIAFGIGQTILHCIAVFQFVVLIINKQPNRALADFGGSLAQWLHDVAAYQSMSTDQKPFPWQPWPGTSGPL